MKKGIMIDDDTLTALMQNLPSMVASELKDILEGKDDVTDLREYLIDAVEGLGEFPILEFVTLDMSEPYFQPGLIESTPRSVEKLGRKKPTLEIVK